MRIPDEWHKEYAFNCLTDEQFSKLQEKHEVGDEFYVDDHDCECESFTLDGYHRCDCGNRRCYLQYGEYEGRSFFYIAVD